VPAADALHATFVRSQVAHGRLVAIDVDEARALPGVAGVFTADELRVGDLPPGPPAPDTFARPVLARDVVRFVGEPVAVVVATTRAISVDAAEAVVVEVEPLPVVLDPVEAAAEGAPVLFASVGSNRAARWEINAREDPLAGAAIRVRGRFRNQRLAPVPMEVNAALAQPDGEGGLTLWVSCQAPFLVREEVAGSLGLPRERVRVVAAAVGGGFGAKIVTYPEQIVVAALALRLGRPVRYEETRSENLVAMTHGRAQVQDVEVGADGDGRITGLRIRVTADLGAYPSEGASLPELTGLMACGVYDVPRVDYLAECVVTNTTPVSAYRGAGRPEATAMIERALDLLAAEIDMDPAELRRRNLIPPFAGSHRTVTGADYDTADYARALEKALHVSGYDELRKEQSTRRAHHDRWLLGIGIACYVEITGWGPEYARVEVLPNGTAIVHTGSCPQGQGHETAFAQIVSETLALPMSAITVLHSDTASIPHGEGTMGSRSLQKGGSAVLTAARAVLDQARGIAGQMLEVAAEDVVPLPPGRLAVAGAPDRSITLAEVGAAAAAVGMAATGGPPSLVAAVDFEGSGDVTFPFGAHVAVVEVDVETGAARLVRHVAVDDCGRVMNPMLVEGQVHGGIAQGAAQALFESVEYDELGTPLTGTLMTYAAPSAAELPMFELAGTETPTPRNPLGARGIGESGTIGGAAAVQNAVIDAVAHLGVRHVDMPATPERMWRALQGRDAGPFVEVKPS
jgi:carbon-monoxide dehydrogenase large subunit